MNLSVEGGTDWIKDAMGEDGPKNEPEFSQSEISDMESLIGEVYLIQLEVVA